jgi:hypothetical protein
VEVAHVLGEYADHIVLVGGWVPKFTVDNEEDPHVGSMDIDLALDHRRIDDEGYRTIEQLLVDRGYREDRQQPFIFRKAVSVRGGEYTVELDLLAGEYGGTGKRHRTQRVQDARPRKARGCDLAFDLFTTVRVEAELPEGGRDSVQLKVASVVPFFTMKGMALAGRLKEKDAYDIYYCLLNYEQGREALVEQFRPHVSHGLVREGLLKMRDKFGSPRDVGPVFVADFLEETDPDERDLLQRDAYERVAYLIDGLGLTDTDH